MTVLQVCAYGATYAGNFIASLEALEAELAKRNIRTIYAFVGRAGEQEWCKKIEKRTKVYYLPEAKARILPKTYEVFRRIYKENDVSIVHSHFELYDIPATVMAKPGTKIFWHLHDPIKLEKQSKSRQILTKLQYGVVGRKATLLAVAEEYRKLVAGLGFPENQTVTLVNGLDLNRVSQADPMRQIKYDFLTFGWDFYRKGGDVILEACRRLAADGYVFRLLFNGNALTWPKLEEYLNGEKPAWLELGQPVENINELFAVSRVFIQASRRETFSYAVCEAAYAGLPVISTDIAGLEWAHDLPVVDFVKNEDVHGLYVAMKAYLEQRKVSAEQVTTSRHQIARHYSVDCWVRKVMAHYGF